LAAGLKIGEFIRFKRFRSIALDTCASVCGLMWLAGTPRFVFSDAAVGFHSAYKEDGSVAGGGNAVIGAAAHLVGLTCAPPLGGETHCGSALPVFLRSERACT
jgi:hypothetical protein